MLNTPVHRRTHHPAVWVWCLFMVCSLQSTLLAQYRFDHWTADNGLPQNSVRDIVQTRDGYVWLTTFDGLARFDGVRFTVFNKSNSPGIVTNRFVMLYEDGQGDLWATTENSGLTRLHAGRFTTWTTEYGLPTNYVTSIGGDGYGGVLLFFGRSLFRWANGKFLPADDLRIADKMDLLDHYQHAVCGGDVSEIRCFVNRTGALVEHSRVTAEPRANYSGAG